MGISAVTGGTGFVGGHLVRLLCERGETVRVLARADSYLDDLTKLPVEIYTGDLNDRNSLTPLVEGASVVYHVAADYRLWSKDPVELYQNNVCGTINMLAAAQKAEVPKIVYTSTVGCLGIPPDGKPGTEDTPVTLGNMIGHYKRSKFLAEKAVLDFVEEGLPVVIVNPSTPIGPQDYKPTPTGKIIIDYLSGRIPAFVDTGLNLVDVKDVALGHILAAEKGKIGEKYILGNKNLALSQILQMLALICGKKPPRIRIPYAVAYAFGTICTAWADKVTHQPPSVSLESVKMARKKMYFSSAKAIRELRLPQSPVENALEEAVRWFADNGYAPGGCIR